MIQKNIDEKINSKLKKLSLVDFECSLNPISQEYGDIFAIEYRSSKNLDADPYVEKILSELQFILKRLDEDNEELKEHGEKEINMMTMIQDGLFISSCYGNKNIIGFIPRYIIMKKIPGEIVNNNISDNNKKYKIMYQFAIALKQLHDKGILHRDINPSNAMFDEIGVVPVINIIDFGSAAEESTININNFTGTIGYCAPELYDLLNKASKQSDIYSLGNTFLQVLMRLDGRFLRDKEGILDVSLEQAVELGVDEDFFNLCKKMTAIDLSKRSKNIEEVIKELEEIFLRKNIVSKVEEFNVLRNAQKFNNILKKYPTEGIEEACRQIVTIIEENKNLGQNGLDLNAGMLSYTNLPGTLAVIIKQKIGVPDQVVQKKKYGMRSYNMFDQAE